MSWRGIISEKVTCVTETCADEKAPFKECVVCV